MTKLKLLFLSTLLIAILTLPTLGEMVSFVRPAEAQQISQKNWTNVNGNKFANNFSPQTQITKDNVQFIELKWVFAFPSAPLSIGGYELGRRREGATASPLVVDGLVYQATNFATLFALDARTGKIVWTYAPKLNLTADRAAGNPLSLPDGQLTHLHGINYFDGMLFYPFPACQVHIVNALTGSPVRIIRDMCKDVPGNKPRLGAGYKATMSYGPVIYEKKRIMIVPAGTTSENNDGARGFFAAYEIDTGRLLWRFFLNPPSGGDPDWAIRDANKGWIMGIRTSEILRVCRQCLENDWGKTVGVQSATGWGQWAIDEETGIAYLASGQPSPDWNATYRPGPNLFSASIIAVKAETGELVWYHQTSTHDMWDWDCAWNVALGKIGDRKVVTKGCKNGIAYMLDANTGEALWTFNPPSIKRCDYCPYHANSLLGSGPKDNSNIGNWDPRDIRTVTRPWMNYPSTGPTWQNPPGQGGIESDVAFAYGKVYIATFNRWEYRRMTPVDPWLPIGIGQVGLPTPESRPTNTTVYALDAATGKPVWTFFIDAVDFRGGITATGGMVFVPSLNGNLYVLDAETGRLIMTKTLGVPMTTPPSFGADANGKMMIFQLAGGTSWATTVPGGVFVFGLPDKLPEPQVITKEVVKEVPKEVIKEVPKEVVREVIKEVPKEVVREVPKEVTKTVTVETIGPVTYASIGVAVVAIVVAGVALTRRKRV